jgi:hypothetical protein
MFLKKKLLQNNRVEVSIMKKQLVIIGIVAILVCVGLSGCNEVSNTLNPEEKKFVGTWQNTTSYEDLGVQNYTLIIFSNGTFLDMGTSGKWDVKDGKFVREFPAWNATYAYNYTFSNNDRTLMLIIYGSYMVYTKQ